MRAEQGSWPSAAAAGAVLAGLAASPVYDPVATVPAAVAVAAAVLSVRPAVRPWQGWSAAAAAAVSIAADAVYPRAGSADVPEAAQVLGYVEMAALMVAAGGVARWAPPRRAVVLAAACGAAVVALVLRLIVASTDVSAAAAATACAIFSAGTAAAVAAGTYLRLLEARRARAVAAARSAQRLELAQDLHDFVAHDVSAIVAQAQAGRLVAVRDPERAAELFARVEEAGQRALSSMDQAVDALRPDRDRPAGRTPQPGLDELPELAERYSGAGPATVALTLEPGLDASREEATTVYRVVVEALTNVRRHAPGAGAVDVGVRRTSCGALEVVVTNDSGGRPSPASRARRRGGTGLPGLAERVGALGGEFTAGPHGGGWRVAAVLPPASGGARR
ncbi:two-component sensor histidine kinase [Actinomadura graeca]|uniref:histidine kinase n=1 Tax=Actinomadura graeca TaxID=2750812 RepID=A0ABX8QX61_9ACTN|nr:histidine kinase [Actinomadura graeca]QXJ23370.1 two-component sensor histidine kinase [Actinomadura graeca]